MRRRRPPQARAHPLLIGMSEFDDLEAAAFPWVPRDPITVRITLHESKNMTTVLYVDSRNRTSGSHSNFEIQLRESLSVNDARFRVDKVTFYDSFYTIEETNRYLYVKNASGFQYFALPVQAYTGSRLAATIQSLTGKPCTYSDVTNSITFGMVGDEKIIDDFELAGFPQALFPADAIPHVTKKL